MLRATGVVLVVSLLAGSQARAQAAPVAAASDAGAELDFAAVLQPFTGDWDAMKPRGMLRALVVYSKTFYFLDRGTQRGLTYELLKAFEDDLNKKLGARALKFSVVFVPVARDELIPALLDGRGDIAAASLTITPDRQKLVDFSAPLATGVSEIVVTGPGGPRISSVEELSGAKNPCPALLELLGTPRGPQPDLHSPGQGTGEARSCVGGTGGRGSLGDGQRGPSSPGGG